jgi:folate-binding protein YgfZ
MKAALLPDRGVVKVVGDNARPFLNGLLTADIGKMTPETPRFAALLTPQGKIIVDCIVVEAPAEDGSGFFLDCPRALAAELVGKLNFYKLRAKVIAEDLSEVLGVLAIWDGAGTSEYGLCYPDPRLPALGRRMMLPPHLVREAAAELEPFPVTLSRKAPTSSPLPVGERSRAKRAGEGGLPIDSPSSPHPNPLQPKSNLSDFGQSKVPNSGKPEFGGERERAAYASTSAPILLGTEVVEASAYEAHRIALGVPRGGFDFVYGDAFPHEADMDQLNGVDFAKGCYVGQEVVSRIEHRGSARKRVVPVSTEAFAPESGMAVMAGDKQIGIMGSGAGPQGLAMLRLDYMSDAQASGTPLVAGGVTIRPRKPPWARFAWPGE